MDGKARRVSRTDVPGPHPTLIYFPSGGAIGNAGRKAVSTLDLLPYLEWGWNVVNVEYNIPGLTLAPVAVENGVCAVRWIVANAQKYGFDTSKLVTAGWSSGGWMALMTAMAPTTPDWDQKCPASADVKIAAVVSRAGETDFADVLAGPNVKPWAAYWFQTLPASTLADVAKSVSPLTFVRAGVPPVISVHGDADQVVPYSQSVRLHQALKSAGVVEELVTVSGAGHFPFTRAQYDKVFTAIEAFLTQRGIKAKQ